MREIQTNRQLWGKAFPVGDEWDAGYTPPHMPTGRSGRWSVRREATRFIVIFHRFHDHQEILLDQFPPDDQGEIQAKTCAIYMHDTRQTTPISKQGA